MPHYLAVSPDEVRAARVHVRAYRTAGLEPDPYLVRVAEAKPRSGSRLRELSERSSVDATTEKLCRFPSVRDVLHGKVQAQRCILAPERKIRELEARPDRGAHIREGAQRLGEQAIGGSLQHRAQMPLQIVPRIDRQR